MGDNTPAAADTPPAPVTAPPPTDKPLSNLPQLHRHVTTHSASGHAVIHTSTPFTWRPYDNNQLAFSVPYTTSTFPPNLNFDADLAAHASIMASGALGLVNPRGTVIRCVDFAPGYACGMHRTQSLDYGIVLEGEVDMVLDGGDAVTMRRGDVAVQRATQHQWVNRSGTEWARMMFVLQDCERVVVAGREMGEDLGTNSGLPASGN
ncbi:hypothetical protein QBC39DRAFT_58830 [Podospora conica]|nr:hypothetical protein QBC39DRAFT_58830 [Schizothecium conicum]